MVVAIAMVRDEEDIIEATVRRMAVEVDELLIADNGSIDGTREILEALARDLPLTVIDDPEPGFFQARKMTALAALASERGADFVVPWDSDEVWWSPFGRVADVLATWPYPLAAASLYDFVATGVDRDEADPVARMRWHRVNPVELPKVAARTSLPVIIHQGNHGASYDAVALTLDRPLVVSHYPLRSPEQMIRKARNGGAAYAATDLPEDLGAHWRGWSALSDDELHEVFRTYYFSEAPERDGSLVRDPCPRLCPVSL